MKVILISKVANYGNIGDIIEVKDGYARNFLIPKNKAIHYSAVNYKTFEDQKKDFEAKNKAALDSAQNSKKILNGKEVIVIENASDDGRLYGAVNNVVIADKVNKISKDLTISRSDVILEKPIKETGVYEIQVNLFADVNAKLKLIVARGEDEIDAVVKQAKADTKKAQEEAEADKANLAKIEAAAEATADDASDKKEEVAEKTQEENPEESKEEVTAN